MVAVLALLIASSAADAASKRPRYDDLPLPGGATTQASPVCSGDEEVQYSFINSTSDLATDTQQQSVEAGMDLWARVADVTFEETAAFVADSWISWRTGDHGDGSSFDGVGGVLAHAFYPCGGGPESDVHFDDAETWTDVTRSTSANPRDLVTVAAHEFGHAIGLDHTSDSGALLQPYYSGSHRFLGWDDIIGVQSLYGRENGTYHLRNSLSGGGPDSSFLFQNLNDKPLVGDWNGDGVDTTGVYRPSNQTFYLRNSNSTGGANYTFVFGSGANGAGSAGDRPVVGDWNGDGVDTIGVYRPSNGAYYLRNTNSAGAPYTVFGFGNTEDLPVAGDWNEDGTDSVGIYRPSTGVFHLKNANNGTPPVDYAIPFGNSGTDDLPVVGDWNNSGTDTPGIYRLSEGRFYLGDSLVQAPPEHFFYYGTNAAGQKVANRLPVSGDFDGNGSSTVGLYQN
ncbi:MAG TPA: M10 family metallopeptidase domain-containing protein [Thermoleophilaceae bacterium]|nr:M10 family metallopeptidase domain-containing protein [Thermoleophilaceae bacterium]